MHAGSTKSPGPAPARRSRGAGGAAEGHGADRATVAGEQRGTTLGVLADGEIAARRPGLVAALAAAAHCSPQHLRAGGPGRRGRGSSLPGAVACCSVPAGVGPGVWNDPGRAGGELGAVAGAARPGSCPAQGPEAAAAGAAVAEAQDSDGHRPSAVLGDWPNRSSCL